MLRIALILSLLGSSLAAQEARRPSHCIAIADAAPGLELVHRASFGAPLDTFDVRISYVDHSMFMIESPDGTSIVTDYRGYVGDPDIVPDVVTMNNAHGSHWTPSPDPRIPHVLPGWISADGAPATYYEEIGDVLVRNVTTDIRRGGGFDGDGIIQRIRDNNSIFIFEMAGLCIGHLGHLHHEPSDEQYAAIGRLDVVMAAVDGGMTVDIATMGRIVSRLRSSVVIPMHWFSEFSLIDFASRVEETFAVRRDGVSSITLSLRDLPSEPTVMILEPRVLALE